jgi:phosphatidylglycerol:prolipoprotein diacylglycerol transferase
LARKPHWLPTLLWAQTYDHDVIGATRAPRGVYPAPLYEIGMGVLAFAILWRLRKLPMRPGWLFSVYLLLCGLERSLIELIRVNPRMRLLGIELTQAQIIAGALIVLGAVGIAVCLRRSSASSPAPS